MNWLQRTSQNWSVTDILNKLLTNQVDINWASEQIASTVGAAACEEIQTFGAVSAEANSIATRLMRDIGCNEYPDAPGAQFPAEQQMQMPALGEQDKPMDMPSAEIV